MDATGVHPYYDLIRTLNRRFDALTPFTQELNRTTVFETWQKNVLGAVLFRGRGNYYHLVYAHSHSSSLELLSWAVRNLLEISIWAKYVTASKDNASRLLQDQIIDSHDFLLAMRDFTLQHTNDPAVLDVIRTQEQIVIKARQENGITDKQPYLHVGTIAKTVGMETTYKTLNKILSKLVHPTGLSMFMATNEQQSASIKSFLLPLGLQFASDILNTFILYFKQAGVDTSVVGTERL